MIHQLLKLERPLVVADVETTGLDPRTDRIVEVGFQVWDADGLKSEWRSLVNPGVPIPADVMKVHGITDETVQHGCRCGAHRKAHPPSGVDHDYGCSQFKPWPTFVQIAPRLAKGFTNVDFAGKNIRFDLRFFAAEFARAGVAWSYIGARIVDADRLEQLGEPRHLSNLYEKHTGRKAVDAHQALVDVRMTTEVIAAQLKKYQMLPRDLDLLHAAQWPGWIDGEGKFRFVDNVACFGSWGKHANKPMAHPVVNAVDHRGETYWDFILKSDFSAEVKELAANAKLGKFPEAR